MEGDGPETTSLIVVVGLLYCLAEKAQAVGVPARMPRVSLRCVIEHERDSLSEILLNASAVELLPLPIATPVRVERLLGRGELLLGPLDLVEDGGVARAGAGEFCEVSRGSAEPIFEEKREDRLTWTVRLSRCRRIDNAGTDEQIDERLLVVIVPGAPDVGNIVVDAEDCEREFGSASRKRLSAKTTHET